MAQPRTLCIQIYSDGSTPEVTVNRHDTVYFVNPNPYEAQITLPPIFAGSPKSPVSIPPMNTDGSFSISHPLKVKSTQKPGKAPYQSVLLIPGHNAVSNNDTIDVGDRMRKPPARKAAPGPKTFVIPIDLNAKAADSDVKKGDLVGSVNFGTQSVDLTNLPDIFVGGPLPEPLTVPPYGDAHNVIGPFPTDPKHFPKHQKYHFTYNSGVTGAAGIHVFTQNDTIDVEG
jgi:hypothetical protein